MKQQSNWQTRAGALFTPEKQAVAGARGVVAANHPLAAAAGVEMLAAGGNAIDAAIATLFTLSVVEPMMVGVFGAGWMNLRLADGTSIIVDNYATAPQAATPTLYMPVSTTWPDYMETVNRANKVGYLAAATPGTLKAWAEAIAQWGRLDLETVMQPAIRYASRGFRASQYLCDIITEAQADLARFPATAQTFLPNGRPPSKGELIVQPDLAAAYKTIADEGPDVFYGGALGQMLVDDIQKNGGILSLADLRGYQTIRRQPLKTVYRGHEVIAPAPPCAGGLHLLQILRLLEGYDVAALGFGTADGIHLLTECFKLVFADRAAYSGDPEKVDVPTEWLLSEAYAAQRRTGIDLRRAATPRAGIRPATEPATTTHVTVADGDGNIACLTQTINDTFGARVTVPGTGMLLNNCMALFDPHPGQPNSVAPGRRTISSMAPTIVLKEGRPLMALGTPGGARIFPSVAQAIINVLDHGMTLQEAVEAPRVWTQGQELEVESVVPDAVCDELTARGHKVLKVPRVAGGMNGVFFDQATNIISGVACWRADGSPVAIGGGPARAGVRF